MDLADPVAVALSVADCLRDGGVPHALYGGLLLAAYGQPRETKDADLAGGELEGSRARGAAF